MVLSGCGTRSSPDLKRIFAGARTYKGKPPLIIIPGILGTELINSRTSEVVWPSIFRSKEDGLSLPITPDIAANKDDLVSGSILVTAKFAKLFPAVDIYRQFLESLETAGGYSEGDWNNPPVNGDHDTYYIYSYDWRHDNVESARNLIRDIRRLKQKLKRSDLRFTVIAHSMGGLVARYAAMYGDTDLPPEGSRHRVEWRGSEDIDKILMFGTPNNGSMESFASFLNGYSVTSGNRRRIRLLRMLSAEDVLTIPSVFQLLPYQREARFLDENLQPISIDLFNIETWKKYGWSPTFNSEFRNRFVRQNISYDQKPQGSATLIDLEAYFANALNRGRRFHEALDAANNATSNLPSPVTIYVFGGDCEDTLAASVIIPMTGSPSGWITLTRPQKIKKNASRKITKEQLTEAMFAPGDGITTRTSFLGESLSLVDDAEGAKKVSLQKSLPVAYAFFNCEVHNDLTNNSILQDNVFTLLMRAVLK